METMTLALAKRLDTATTMPRSEDAYYLRHAASDRRLPRTLSAVAALAVLVITAFGLPLPS